MLRTDNLITITILTAWCQVRGYTLQSLVQLIHHYHNHHANQVFGRVGDVIDTLSVICTMFGVCTSLGLGVIQLSVGINRFNPAIAVDVDTQVILIWMITAIATVSVLSGIKVSVHTQ